MSKKLSVSIVIPTYNGRHLLEKHIPSVLKASGEAEVIVVDDASTDDTLDWLKDNYPDILLVQHEENRRFAAACNSGVRQARGDIVVLMNNDVEPEMGFVEPLMAVFEDDLVFAVGCKEYDGNVVSGRSGGNFARGLYVHWRSQDQEKTDTLWVSGGSGAYRKSIWKQLGGMDTLFAPAYQEDRDICYRAMKRGYKVCFCPESIVHHQHETTNTTALGIRRMQIASFKNQFLFVWKNIGDRGLLLQHFLWLPYQLVIGGLRTRGILVRGFVQALRQLGAVLQKRLEEQRAEQVPDRKIIDEHNYA